LNTIEKILLHALRVHAHHNADQVLDFGMFTEVNKIANLEHPGLMVVEPHHNDDAGVIRLPGTDILLALKLESHCSPSVIEPWGSVVTCVTGTARDIVAMGGRPLAVLDFIGTLPSDAEVLVGPCGLKGDGKTCDCGNCETMTVGARNKLMLKGICDACKALKIGVSAGGFSTSIRGVVPAVVAGMVGELVVSEPLMKPARQADDRLILIGLTGNDGNDTVYRAGFADAMRPAKPLLEDEKVSMDGALAAFGTGRVVRCSDLGAAGIGAAVHESARFGGLGAWVDLKAVLLTEEGAGNTPEETLTNETQGRYMLHVEAGNVAEVLEAIRATGAFAVEFGRITDTGETVFVYDGDVVAVLPNELSEEAMDELRSM